MLKTDESLMNRPHQNWNYLRSHVVPSNVTPTQARTSLASNDPLTTESALRPALHPTNWYEVADRTKPSVSSF